MVLKEILDQLDHKVLQVLMELQETLLLICKKKYCHIGHMTQALVNLSLTVLLRRLLTHYI